MHVASRRREIYLPSIRCTVLSERKEFFRLTDATHAVYNIKEWSQWHYIKYVFEIIFVTDTVFSLYPLVFKPFKPLRSTLSTTLWVIIMQNHNGSKRGVTASPSWNSYNRIPFTWILLHLHSRGCHCATVTSNPSLYGFSGSRDISHSLSTVWFKHLLQKGVLSRFGTLYVETLKLFNIFFFLENILLL